MTSKHNDNTPNTPSTPTPDRASLTRDDWGKVMYKFTLFKLPALFILLLCSAGYFWGTMGLVVVLATAMFLPAIGYLLKEL